MFVMSAFIFCRIFIFLGIHLLRSIQKICFSSRIFELKKEYLILEFAKFIFDIDKRYVYTVAGPFKDKKTEQAVRSFISENHLENVQIIGPVYDEECKMKMYSEAGVLLFPSC